jgi:two-component system invasion response regulator UvrY
MSDFSPKECVRKVDELSPQLRAVLRAMALGQPTKQIADEMQLSIETVKTYRERVYSRLGVNSMACAVRVAVVAKII